MATKKIKRRFFVVLDLETEVKETSPDDIWDLRDIALWVEYALGKSLDTDDNLDVTVYSELGDVVQDAYENQGAFTI